MASSKEGTGTRVVDEWHPSRVPDPSLWAKNRGGRPGSLESCGLWEAGYLSSAGHMDRWPLALASRPSAGETVVGVVHGVVSRTGVGGTDRSKPVVRPPRLVWAEWIVAHSLIGDALKLKSVAESRKFAIVFGDEVTMSGKMVLCVVVLWLQTTAACTIESPSDSALAQRQRAALCACAVICFPLL